MSKASYRAKQSGHLGPLNQQPHPKRKITLKLYRRLRRTRHREAKKLWKLSLNAWSGVGKEVKYYPPVDFKAERRR